MGVESQGKRAVTLYLIQLIMNVKTNQGETQMKNFLNNQINEYLEYCKYRKRLNDKTIKAYRIDLTQYSLNASDDTAFQIECVDRYVTMLHKQYEPKT